MGKEAEELSRLITNDIQSPSQTGVENTVFWLAPVVATQASILIDDQSAVEGPPYSLCIVKQFSDLLEMKFILLLAGKKNGF